MPIRYFIDLDCQPRETLGPESLIDLVSRREMAEAIAQQLEEKGSTAAPEQMAYEERRAGLEEKGAAPRQTTVAEVRRETRALEQLAHHCNGCPAALNGQPFSCHSRLNLPLSGTAEEWIGEQAAPQASEAFALLRDGRPDGRGQAVARLERWRQAGFLASPEPMVLSEDNPPVTTDDILRELLLVGDLMPAHALGVLLHLRALRSEDGREGDELLTMIARVNESGSAEDASPIQFALGPTDEDDPSVIQLKVLLFAAYIAFSLQAPLAIRL